MQIGQISAAGLGASQIQNANISQDFETFLRMLTTQIQNQDPLRPMAADQFASQLASFSMVEQQTLTNQKMDMLAAAMGAGRITAFAPVVGRFALHDGPFEFSGANITFEISDVPEAEGKLKLVILNANSSVVSERLLEPEQSQVIWDGTDPEGRFVLPGSYSAELRRVEDEAVVDAGIATGGVVEEVRFGTTHVELVLANGAIIPESSVRVLR